MRVDSWPQARAISAGSCPEQPFLILIVLLHFLSAIFSAHPIYSVVHHHSNVTTGLRREDVRR